MTNIYLNGLINTAPMELNNPYQKHFYYDFAPTELIFCYEAQKDPMVYHLYDFTEEEIKIVEGNG
jgi:hypothetical protein